MSERTVGEAFEKIFINNRSRILVATLQMSKGTAVGMPQLNLVGKWLFVGEVWLML